MKKRLLPILLSAILLLIMSFSLFSCDTPEDDDDTDVPEEDNDGGSDTKAPPITEAQKETNADGLIFVKYENSYYSVIGYTAPANSANLELTVPGTFKDLPVKSIASRVFIPNTVDKNTNLKKITVSEGITVISANAFSDCANVKEIVLPSTITEIGREAFSRCKNLKNVNIPASVSSIGDSAFESCYSLENITVSADSTTFQSIDGSLYSKDGKTLVRYAIGKGGSIYDVPATVTTLARGAFQAASFTEVNLPASVIRIEPDVFKDCTSLTKVSRAVTSGWWYSSYSDATSGSAINDSATAFATKLKDANSLGKRFINRTV